MRHVISREWRRVDRGLVALLAAAAALSLAQRFPCAARQGRLLRNSRTSSILSTSVDAETASRVEPPMRLASPRRNPGLGERRRAPRLNGRQGRGRHGGGWPAEVVCWGC
jgi:hypothetical protein